MLGKSGYLTRRSTDIKDNDGDSAQGALQPITIEDTREESSSVAIPLERRFFNLRTALSFVVAFVIVAFVFSRMNIDAGEVIADIRGANIAIYVAAFLVYYLSFPLRAWRWQVLLSNVGYRRAPDNKIPSTTGLGEIILLSWFANCIVPAKLGDAYRAYLLKRTASVSFSRTMGTVLAERIFDMLVLFVLMSVSGLRIFGEHLPDIVEYLFVAGAALAVIIVAALLVMKHFGRRLERRLPGRLRSIYVRFEEGTLLSFRNIPLLLLLTILVWAVEAGRLWLILAALGMAHVGPLVVIFISLAASLITTLPVTPAGLGLVETSVTGILVFLNSIGTVQGVTTSLATSAAILDRSISYWSVVVIGLLAYIFSKKK